jgi:hypothetical protein
VKEIHRWMLTRLLFSLKIVRYSRHGDDRTWIDFVTIEDSKGQTLYDCVATIHGDPPARNEFGPPRCGSAFIAAKDLHFEGIVVSGTDCTKEHTLLDRPAFWPVWQPPFPKVSASDRENALAFSVAVRKEELEDPKDFSSNEGSDEDIGGLELLDAELTMPSDAVDEHIG